MAAQEHVSLVDNAQDRAHDQRHHDCATSHRAVSQRVPSTARAGAEPIAHCAGAPTHAATGRVGCHTRRIRRLSSEYIRHAPIDRSPCPAAIMPKTNTAPKNPGARRAFGTNKLVYG